MSVNKYKPHVFVIPEDDADRQIADGFVLHAQVDTRQVQVVEPAGGWVKVLETFQEEYLRLLRQNQNAHVVMLIDFDEQLDRRTYFNSAIPDEIRNRVFIVGTQSNPEVLKQTSSIHSFEGIGRALADDCDKNEPGLWNNIQLIHNADERLRLVDVVKPFLFI